MPQLSQRHSCRKGDTAPDPWWRYFWTVDDQDIYAGRSGAVADGLRMAMGAKRHFRELEAVREQSCGDSGEPTKAEHEIGNLA